VTYPNQQQYPPQAPPQQPGYPQQPAAQPGYPPAQPQYPAQQTQYPPAAPGYPPQQAYAQPQQAPPPPLPRTTAADYLEQPSMGGMSLQFPAIGTWHTGTVARDLGDADFPVQTERDGVTPKRFRDGRIMVRMVVPLNVRPDQRHTDGKATLSVQGQMSEALKQAMSKAGAGHLNGIPEDGAEISVGWVNQIPPKTPGFSPTKVYEVVYKRPAGAAPGAQGNGQAQEQPPWTPQMAEQAGQAAVAQMAQAGSPLAQAAYPAVATSAGTWPPQDQQQAPAAPQWQPAPPPAPTQFDGAPLQAPQGPPAPQMPAAPPPGMAGPAQQVAYATQAAQTAGQAYQQPQQAPPIPLQSPYIAALMKKAQGNTLTPEEEAALAAGPPQ
jgi:hypothetical protein